MIVPPSFLHTVILLIVYSGHVYGGMVEGEVTPLGKELRKQMALCAGVSSNEYCRQAFAFSGVFIGASVRPIGGVQ